MRGFSLVELVIVVVIVGLLAAIALPRMSKASSGASERAFARQLRMFSDAIGLYYADHPGAGLLPDTTTGEMPEELQPYIPLESWERFTPVGGEWDHEHTDSNFAAGLGVDFTESGDLEQMRGVDALIDDGDLETGSFRSAAGQYSESRFYFDVTP